MIKLRYLVLTLLLITATSSDVYAQKYVQISTEKQSESKDIIIYEFFWYGCPHCFNLEPTIDRIEADLETDTKIVKVPVALRESWTPHAKLYYALKQMNKVEEVHNLIFEEIHIENNILNNEDLMIDFLDKNNIDTVIIAGKEYGTGSSRDWAAKGTKLLGIKAVIAESFERIHRSNLILSLIHI